jgi:hypothetical protein
MIEVRIPDFMAQLLNGLTEPHHRGEFTQQLGTARSFDAILAASPPPTIPKRGESDWMEIGRQRGYPELL